MWQRISLIGATLTIASAAHAFTPVTGEVLHRPTATPLAFSMMESWRQMGVTPCQAAVRRF